MEQGGLYSLILYENNNLSYIYPELDNENLISEILNTSNYYTFTGESRPTYKQEKKIGKNFDYIYNYSVKVNLWDFSVANLNALETIRSSIYGYVALLYLKATQTYNVPIIKLLKVPLFLKPNFSFDPVNGHIFNLEFINQVPSRQDLIEFQNPDAKDWILDTGFWDDDGIWKDTSVWID